MVIFVFERKPEKVNGLGSPGVIAPGELPNHMPRFNSRFHVSSFSLFNGHWPRQLSFPQHISEGAFVILL